MDTREWKPVNDDVRWARFFDFYHRYPVTSNRVHTVHHVDPNSWIHASLENARNTRNRVKTREKEIGARDSCRASRVFRARARFRPLSPRNAERKPTDRDLVSTLCLRAEPANRIDLHDRASGNLRSGRFLRDKYFSICVRPIKRNDFSYDR